MYEVVFQRSKDSNYKVLVVADNILHVIEKLKKDGYEDTHYNSLSLEDITSITRLDQDIKIIS